VGYIKQIANRISDITQETYSDLEADLMGIALQTKDHKEGLTAFWRRENLFLRRIIVPRGVSCD